VSQAPAGVAEARRLPVVSRGVAFWLVGYAFGAVMLGTTLPTPLYPLYEQRYGLSPTLITMVFAIYAVGVITGLVLLGRASDIVGRRAILLPGVALSAASAVVFLLEHNSAELFAGRVLSGLSAGIFTGTATATMLDLAPPNRRSFATGAAIAFNLGGLAMGPLTAGVLAEWAPDPLRLAFAVDLLLLVPAFMGVLLAPETVNTEGRRFRLQVQRLQVPAPMRVVFWQAVIAGFGGFAVSGLFGAVAPNVMGQLIGIRNHAVVGTVVFLLLAVSAAAQLATRSLPWRTGLVVGCIALLAGVGLLAVALALGSFPVLLLTAVAAGVGQGVTIGSGLAAVNERVPAEHRGEVASTYFVGLYVGLIIPVIGVGLAVDAVGLRSAGLAFSAVVAVLVIAVLVSLVRSRP
jgi:MFS family permease